MFIEILFKMLLFKGGVLIYAEHCMYTGGCVNDIRVFIFGSPEIVKSSMLPGYNVPYFQLFHNHMP